MKLVLTGDWHIGAATTDVDQIKAIAKKYWKDKPVILMGDIADFGYFKGMQFNQSLHPQEQVNEVEEICNLLDVKGYCLGNHEARVYEMTGLNPYQPFLHMKPSNWLKVDGKVIYFNHGKSTAKNIFLEHGHLSEWVRADVIMLGHNHSLAYKPVVTSEGKVVYHVRTGAFIGHANYAKRGGLGPHLKGWVEYDTKKHVIHLMAIDKYGRVKEI